MELKRVVIELMNIFKENLKSIVLFGSYARKNYDENSDIDLIVVVDKYKEYNLAKLRKSYLINYGRRLDIHIFSKKDVIKNFEHFSPLFVTLLLGKKIIFDKEMFFKKSFENFVKKMANKDIKYCEGGKIWRMQKIARNLKALL